MSIYNVRDPPRMGDWEICRGKKKIVATRTETVSKSKRTIFKNHSPHTSSRKDFLT